MAYPKQGSTMSDFEKAVRRRLSIYRMMAIFSAAITLLQIVLILCPINSGSDLAATISFVGVACGGWYVVHYAHRAIILREGLAAWWLIMQPENHHLITPEIKAMIKWFH